MLLPADDVRCNKIATTTILYNTSRFIAVLRSAVRTSSGVKCQMVVQLYHVLVAVISTSQLSTNCDLYRHARHCPT
jgi:hypothetical protein